MTDPIYNIGDFLISKSTYTELVRVVARRKVTQRNSTGFFDKDKLQYLYDVKVVYREDKLQATRYVGLWCVNYDKCNIKKAAMLLLKQ